MDRGCQGGVNGNGDRQSPVSNKNDRKGKEIDAQLVESQATIPIVTIDEVGLKMKISVMGSSLDGRSC